MSDCVFCDRIENNDYCGEARGIVSFEPLNPVTPGHRLFVPRHHCPDAGQHPWIAANTFEVAAA